MKLVALLSNNICKDYIPFFLLIIDDLFATNRNEKYGGLKNDHLILNKQNDNKLCNESKKEEIINQTRQQFVPNTDSSQGRFQVEVKTGHTGFLGLGGAGTDAPVFIQIYDKNGQKSEALQLKNSTRHINKFERNQTGFKKKLFSRSLLNLIFNLFRSFYCSYRKTIE